jgi:hypothetical protein
MCNCARASLKALQVLGSSHRGLSMANWRLVFNAVCLPVLTYGCQLWANLSNIKSLMKKVQGVFNEGVKVISGAFRTAPREPLHEFLQILPARHFIEKLTHTSALRLYRVPRESQLLSHLGHKWDPSVQTGVDRVFPGPSNVTSWNGSGRSTQRPTALEALGTRVPSEAPHTDVVAIAPWEVPDWGARLQFLDRTHPVQRKQWVDGLYGAVTPTSGAIIRVAGTISNKDRSDNRMVGACAAVLSQGGDREDLVRLLSRLHIFYRFIWIYSDLFDRGFVSKSLSLDMIRSCHVMCHVTYKPFVQWHVTLGESCHSHTDIHDWIDKPRA